MEFVHHLVEGSKCSISSGARNWLNSVLSKFCKKFLERLMVQQWLLLMFIVAVFIAKSF